MVDSIRLLLKGSDSTQVGSNPETGVLYSRDN